MDSLHSRAASALCNNDVAELRKMLSENRELVAELGKPLGPFGQCAIQQVRTREMLDLLLEFGADLNARSDWWAGSYGLLDTAPQDLSHYALSRGARLTIHAAVRLQLTEKVEEFLGNDSRLVHSRGPDGQTPLHLCQDVHTAELLLKNGADVNARDIDHESTPAQYMIGDRQEIVRFLLAHGAETDLLMAAALGDRDQCYALLERNPAAIRMRVDSTSFPMRNPRAGGTIYQWTLGFYVSPHQVARKFRHTKVEELLFQHSPLAVQVVNACWLKEQTMLQRLLSASSYTPEMLRPEDHVQLAHAARNNQPNVLELMLRAGLSISCRGQHGGTPVHWAAWHGNTRMLELLLQHKPDLADRDNEFHATPLGWAKHGRDHGWFRDKGDYDRAEQLLQQAGATE